MTTYTIDNHKTAVVFSATWCSTCGPFKRKLEAQGVPFLNAQMDKEVSAGLSVATGWEEGQDIMDIAKVFSIKSLPTTFIFQGKEVIARVIGSDIEAVKAALK
jgi:thioredoxin-related protein